MPRLKLSAVLFWLWAGVDAVLLVAFGLILSGALPLDPASEPGRLPDALEQPQSTAAPRATARIAQSLTTTPGTTTTGTALTVVVLSAVRGDSWFSARVGSERGRILDERILRRGEAVRLRAERIWLSIGAAGNIEVTVDGEPRELSGTVSVVLPPGDTTAK